MIIPCIDLMDRKVVQLVQGREKKLELPDPPAVLAKFADYPEIQVIDLDAAIGGQEASRNVGIVRELCARKPCRVGGGIRSVERAAQVVDEGAVKVIVGSSAFTPLGVNHEFLRTLAVSIPRERIMIAVDSLGGQVAIHGWRTVLPLKTIDAIKKLESYCSEFLSTYIDGEGKLQGTNLGHFRSLRAVTNLPITAAGGITTDEEIAALDALGMHAALGMAIYRKVFPELFAEF
jgi:phosphoribosylformimino-5-aminoimidazole carboxamide ribonucleotide (ProFAR) isomerase